MKPALPLALVAGAFLLAALPHFKEEVPWPLREGTWRTDATWHDGLAEVCVYDATRTIYDKERRYEARAYTNVQRMDPGTFVKAADPDDPAGVEVFKHHWSERVPTEAYDYDFSTAVFLTTEALEPFRLTVGTQEDCGASFKNVRFDGSDMTWFAFVYLPGEGLSRGHLDQPVGWVDALTLSLRDYPFDEMEPGTTHELLLLPSQKTPRAVPFEPVRHRLTFIDVEVIDVPAGQIPCFHLRLEPPDASPTDLWFAGEGAAPWLHALVRLEGPEGVSYRLRSLERAAYWERG